MQRWRAGGGGHMAGGERWPRRGGGRTAATRGAVSGRRPRGGHLAGGGRSDARLGEIMGHAAGAGACAPRACWMRPCGHGRLAAQPFGSFGRVGGAASRWPAAIAWRYVSLATVGIAREMKREAYPSSSCCKNRSEGVGEALEVKSESGGGRSSQAARCSRRAMRRQASSMRGGSSMRAKRTKPSPALPKPLPGETATWASRIRRAVTSVELRPA